MNKSVDGFVPRNRVAKTKSIGTPEATHNIERASIQRTTRPVMGDISSAHDNQKSDSFTIELPEKLKHKKSKWPKIHKEEKLKDIKKKPSIVRRIIRAFLLLIALGAAATVVFVFIYIGIPAITASNNVFEGGLMGYLKKDRLKTDSEGRTNVLIFGTADEGKGHDGELLTDSLMVVSFNQDQKTATLVSIPRDLYVQYDVPCAVGYYGRINAVYECGSSPDGSIERFGENEKAGAAAIQKVITRVTGLDIQYYVHLSFTAIIKTVDIVGGVEVVIDSPDPRGVYDPNFDWECNYTCTYVKYKNGPTGLMDGKHALALARARNAAGGYGLPGSNFDREQYQQKIMIALLEKATSTGTLTDLNKVRNLINSLGNKGYLYTSIATSEVRTFLDVGTGVNGDEVEHVSLADQVRSANVSGSSVLVPSSGLYDYSGIHGYIAQYLSTDNIVKEGATVNVYNSSSTTGLAAALKNELTNNNINVVNTGNSTYQPAGYIVIFDMGNKKKATRAKLEELYGVKVTSKNELPEEFASDEADFIIVIADEKGLANG